ncbi:MAG: hypothetical protein ACTSSH_02705 [Candidatus Heimdallarchaeota archaeon]
MKLSFPLTPDVIREGMLEIISEIKEESGWDFVRDLSDVTINLGVAPKSGLTFGVTRSDKALIFADWLTVLEPLVMKNYVVEFVIIRESLALLFGDYYFTDSLREITDLYLNIFSLSVLLSHTKEKWHDNIINNINSRFLVFDAKSEMNNKIFLYKIASMISSNIKQNITYTLLINTFKHFIEDIPPDEISFGELTEDFYRYLSSSPLELASPIIFKDRAADIFVKLNELGFGVSTNYIAKDLGIDFSTVSKQISKITSKFFAKWRIERNWSKLGLHSYLVLVTFTKDDLANLEKLTDELTKIPYVFEIFIGENSTNSYLYSVIYSPHITIENLANKLEQYQKNGFIKDFKIKTINRRRYRTALLSETKAISHQFFSDLLVGNANYRIVDLWSSEKFSSNIVNLRQSDEPILEFLSILIDNSITAQGDYGVHITEAYKFLERNNLSLNNLPESLKFFNRLHKEIIKRNLADYRLTIRLSYLITSDMLVIRLKLDPELKSTQQIIDTLSCFSWTVILETSDEVLLIILGPTYDNALTEIISNRLNEQQLDYELFSMKQKTRNIILYNKLFDFDNKKWRY